MAAWQLQEAKGRFSEVIKRAVNEGPQEITVHGKSVAMIVSKAQYAALAGSTQNFAAFVRNSPLLGSSIKLKREQTTVRELKL